MARYQDLSREQAAGIGARILFRLPAATEISEGADPEKVGDYFYALMSLANCLVDVAIGNRSFKDIAEDLAALKPRLDDASFLSARSRNSAEAPQLIAIAAGAPGDVQYYAAPGLHERDRRNPELAMSISMAADALTKIGITRETFADPAESDCTFILNTRNSRRATLDPIFFGRLLWPENTPWAVRHMLIKNWSQRMRALGLQGLAHSFEGCQDGLFPTSNNQVEESRMANHVTINLDNGSRWSGPITVGRDIQAAYQAVAHSGATELAKALEKVVDLSANALDKLPDNGEKETAASQLKTFVQEAKAEKPEKWLLEASGKGLVEMFGKVAGTVAPVATAIAEVLKLVNG